MDRLSASLALKSLDCLALRAEVSASNIANAGTAGYRPKRVEFEAMLSAAAADGAPAVNRLKPRVTQQVDNLTGAALRLDAELATASSTALRYSALVEVLNRHLRLEKLAISGSAR